MHEIETQIHALAQDRLGNLVAEHFGIAICIDPHKDIDLVGRC